MLFACQFAVQAADTEDGWKYIEEDACKQWALANGYVKAVDRVIDEDKLQEFLEPLFKKHHATRDKPDWCKSLACYVAHVVKAELEKS